MSSQLVWLITGTSTGFGRYLTLAALKRGDEVIATARASSLSKLDDLKNRGAAILELDVTASPEDLREVAKKAIGIYGRIDVLVNNAGTIIIGAIEEKTPEEVLNQFQTNMFGAMNVTNAFLPYMRGRKTGTMVFIGSYGSWRPYPGCGYYVASKAAIRELSITLHEEISPLGLRSVCIEPGTFRTEVLSHETRTFQHARIADYQNLADQAKAELKAANGKQPGDPEKGAEVIVDVVREEGAAKGKPFPTIFALGNDAYSRLKVLGEETLARLEQWKDVSTGTDFIL